MSRPTTPTCDQCQRQKGATNHWWTAFVQPDIKCLEFSPWAEHPGVPQGFTLYDICSEECAHRLLGKWMRGELGK